MEDDTIQKRKCKAIGIHEHMFDAFRCRETRHHITNRTRLDLECTISAKLQTVCDIILSSQNLFSASSVFCRKRKLLTQSQSVMIQSCSCKHIACLTLCITRTTDWFYANSWDADETHSNTACHPAPNILKPGHFHNVTSKHFNKESGE